MLSLNRTLSFTTVYYISLCVAKYLKFNMFWVFYIFLNKYRRIVERLFCFFARNDEQFLHLIRFPYYPHTPATASGCCFYNYRIANFSSNQNSFFFISYITFTSHCHWDSACQSNCPGNRLIPHFINGIRGGADIKYFIIDALLSKISVLRKKTITRMNSICICLQGNSDQLFNIQKHRNFRYILGIIKNYIST